jgi:hypothetical protein
MVTLSLRDPHVIGTLAASVLAIGGVAAWLLTRRRPTPEEIERERRVQLVRAGRIIDGTILDVSESAVSEFDPASPPQFQEIRFILYKYEIGGVAYECSQDVSALRDHVKPQDLRLGFPCSVRYDVHRPENSIVVADNWSGLRQTARSVPTRRSPPARKSRPSSVPGQLSPRD